MSGGEGGAKRKGSGNRESTREADTNLHEAQAVQRGRGEPEEQALRPPADQQPFEIVALGKRKRGRMVRSRAESSDNRCIGIGIDGGAGDDLAKEIGVDAAGTGERRQVSANAQQFHRPQVDVLVRTCGAFGMGGGRRELRWIDDNEIEAARCVAAFAQFGKGVGFEIHHAFAIQRRVDRDVVARLLRAFAELSIETTLVAPPASAANVKPPV